MLGVAALLLGMATLTAVSATKVKDAERAEQLVAVPGSVPQTSMTFTVPPGWLVSAGNTPAAHAGASVALPRVVASQRRADHLARPRGVPVRGPQIWVEDRAVGSLARSFFVDGAADERLQQLGIDPPAALDVDAERAMLSAALIHLRLVPEAIADQVGVVMRTGYADGNAPRATVFRFQSRGHTETVIAERDGRIAVFHLRAPSDSALRRSYPILLRVIASAAPELLNEELVTRRHPGDARPGQTSIG